MYIVSICLQRSRGSHDHGFHLQSNHNILSPATPSTRYRSIIEHSSRAYLTAAYRQQYISPRLTSFDFWSSNCHGNSCLASTWKTCILGRKQAMSPGCDRFSNATRSISRTETDMTRSRKHPTNRPQIHLDTYISLATPPNGILHIICQ